MRQPGPCRTCLGVLLLWLAWCTCVRAAESLEIAVRSTPPGTLSTAVDTQAVLRVGEGETARYVLHRTPQDERWAVAVAPWGATATPAPAAEALRILQVRPHLNGRRVRLEITSAQTDAAHAGSAFTTTVELVPGRWVRVLGTAGTPTRGVRRYATRDPASPEIWVRVRLPSPGR